jgi:hypothetical protein
MYALSATEIAQLSSFNTTSTVYFSLSGALIGYAVAIFTNAAFYAEKTLTPLGDLALRYLAPGLCVLALGAFLLAVSARQQRHRLLRTIIGGSEEAH